MVFMKKLDIDSVYLLRFRIVGSYDSQQNLIKCVAIREALQNEYAAHQQNVQKCAEYKLKLSNMVREQ